MRRLADRLGVPVEPVEAIGFDGDAIEAQCFAYLALRSRRGLPLSFPTTTGVPAPMTGGVFWPAPQIEKGPAYARPRSNALACRARLLADVDRAVAEPGAVRRVERAHLHSRGSP